MRRLLRYCSANCVLLFVVDDVELGDLRELRGDDGLLDVVEQVEAEHLAVLADVGHALVDRVADVADLDLVAVLVDLARDEGAVRPAEDAHRELGAAGAHQPGEADDLAAAHEEARVLHDEPVGDLRVLHDPVLHLEEHLADVRRVVGEAALERAADHPADDAVLVDAVFLHVERLDGAAVADDRDLVGDLLDLVELVGDHDRADALALQPQDEVEQVAGVGLVERRGRLVEDEQLDLLVQRLGDLDQLLLADADVLDLGVGVVGEADPGEQLGGAASWLPASR